MKLNKVLALALSGVMAVSMLAGCSGKTDDNKDEQEISSQDVVVASVNDVQKDNDVKIEFKYDGELESALKTAVEAVAITGGSDTEIAGIVSKVMDIDNTEIRNFMFAKGNQAQQEGTQTVVAVTKATDNTLPNTAIAESSKNVNTNVLSKLAASSAVVGGVVYNYTYEGQVAAVTTTAADGTVSYYFVYVVTGTSTRALA